MLQNPCPWTAAAVAALEHSWRARDAAHDMRKVAASIEDIFGTVIRDAMALADREDRMADSLVWISDVCIFLAQHGDAFQHFRATLEAGKTAQTAERIALRYSRRTMPVGGAAAAPLQQARARR